MKHFIDELLRELETKLPARYTDEDVERLFTISHRVASYRFQTLQEHQMLSPDASREYVRELLKGEEREHFGCLFLSTQHHVLAHEILFSGTVDVSVVYPREVIKAALKHNAAAVVFFHNHPGGAVNPSDADKKITDKLKLSLDQIDVRVLDHIIVGLEGSFSFAEHGYV